MSRGHFTEDSWNPPSSTSDIANSSSQRPPGFQNQTTSDPPENAPVPDDSGQGYGNRSSLDIRPNEEPDFVVPGAETFVTRTESIYRIGEATPGFDPQDMTETTFAGFYQTLKESVLVAIISGAALYFCPNNAFLNVWSIAIYASLIYLTRRVGSILVRLCDGVPVPTNHGYYHAMGFNIVWFLVFFIGLLIEDYVLGAKLWTDIVELVKS